MASIKYTRKEQWEVAIRHGSLETNKIWKEPGRGGGGGGVEGVLAYIISYVGMCRCEGYGFQPV